MKLQGNREDFNSLVNQYLYTFNVFTWDDNKRTVANYQEYVKKMLLSFEIDLKRETYNNIKQLLK